MHSISIYKLYALLIFIFILSYVSLLLSSILCYILIDNEICLDMSYYIKKFIDISNLLKK